MIILKIISNKYLKLYCDDSYIKKNGKIEICLKLHLMKTIGS